MDSDGSEISRTSSILNFADSDITIESSDNVRFLLHRKNLETHTEAFPGSEFEFDNTRGDIVKLTEAAEILEILFQFIYPRKQPSLSSLEVETLLALAEAVQKYQVFSAMHACESHLSSQMDLYYHRKYVQSHTASILVHALKHYGNYESLYLVNECANLLVRKKQTVTVVRKIAEEGLNSFYIVQWIVYETMWEDVFDKLKNEIDKIPLHQDCWSENLLCSNCRNCLISWADDLRGMTTIPALQEALEHPTFLKQHHEQTHDRCHYCRFDECKHRAPLVTFCDNLVKAMPGFTMILDAKVATSGVFE